MAMKCTKTSAPLPKARPARLNAPAALARLWESTSIQPQNPAFEAPAHGSGGLIWQT